jgi:hypothetical protein
MRRLREREAAGVQVVTTGFTQAETAKLARLGYLREGQLEDRKRIVAALHALIADINPEPL